MRCGYCESPNARLFNWAGVTSVRCPDCGSDLLPGVDISERRRHEREETEYYERMYQDHIFQIDANQTKEDPT